MERTRKLMQSKNIDNPEIDLAWPEHMYLRKRLDTLRERRRKILEQLARPRS